MPDAPSPATLLPASSFDTAAEAYARYRPAYPAELIETLLARSGIGAGAQVLEIGCGTGKATAQLAGRGFDLLALDPGEQLLAVARRELAGDPQIRFACSRFEDWPAPSAQFDLVLSAQAFHWLDTAIACPAIARTLKPGGWLALLWHTDDWGETPIRLALDRIYAEFMPRTAPPADMARRAEHCVAALLASGRFGPPEVHVACWTQTFTSERYLGLLSSFSDHICLPDRQREALFAAIRQAIEDQGGRIEKRWRSLLHLLPLR